MRIAISGSTGLIGSAAVEHFRAAGHDVAALVRFGRPAGASDVRWDAASGYVDAEALAGCDAVIHLAGENIAGRWTAARKARIRDSRVAGTAVLCEAIASLERPPAVLACASGIGWYGDRGDEILTEDAPPGEGFLAGVCRDWEAACRPAVDAGVRVVSLRFGMVLSADGGALPAVLTPFRLGLGGRVGNGRQYWSWIALDDVVAAIERMLTDAKLAGPVNVVSPEPVINAAFTRTLGRVLGRPTLLPMPALAVRLALGKMADELLLASARVVPGKLQAAGFAFRYPQLEAALTHVLGKAGG